MYNPHLTKHSQITLSLKTLRLLRNRSTWFLTDEIKQIKQAINLLEEEVSREKNAVLPFPKETK